MGARRGPWLRVRRPPRRPPALCAAPPRRAAGAPRRRRAACLVGARTAPQAEYASHCRFLAILHAVRSFFGSPPPAAAGPIPRTHEPGPAALTPNARRRQGRAAARRDGSGAWRAGAQSSGGGGRGRGRLAARARRCCCWRGGRRPVQRGREGPAAAAAAPGPRQVLVWVACAAAGLTAPRPRIAAEPRRPMPPPPHADPLAPSRWRCAPWLEAGAPRGTGLVAEVWPKQLTGPAAAAALRSGRPVLLRGTRLSGCRLAAAAPPAAREDAGGSPAHDDDDDDDALPSVWRRGDARDASGACTIGVTAAAAPPPAAVLASPAACARFMRCDAARNLPGSYYELRAPHAECRTLPGLGPRAWRERWRAWGAHALLLAVRGWGLRGGGAAPARSTVGVLPLLRAPTVGARGCSDCTRALATNQVDVCSWELAGGGGAAAAAAAGAARVRPNRGAWGDLAELLLAPTAGGPGGAAPKSPHAAAAPPAGSDAGAGARLAEGLLDWHQLRFLLEVGGSAWLGPQRGAFCPAGRCSPVLEPWRPAHARPPPRPVGCGPLAYCLHPSPPPRAHNQAGRWTPAGAAALQAGPPGCLLPARYEAHDTLVVQLEGARRVLLVAPDMVGAPCARRTRTRARARALSQPPADRAQRTRRSPASPQRGCSLVPPSRPPPLNPPCPRAGVPWRGALPGGPPLRRLQLPRL
jgi:hypothetical protein